MIVAIGPAHPPVLAALHEAAFPPGESWNTAIMAAQLGLPGMLGFIDEAGGMILVRVAADEAEVLTLAVAPDARRRGLGRGLVLAAAGRAADLGAARLFLEVSASNGAARALYEGLDFVRVGLRRRYCVDGSDALLLARTLRPAAGQ